MEPSLSCSSGANSVWGDDWTVKEGKTQPWKSFWPPNRIEDPTIWQNSEFPEVASWTFDKSQSLIDRPWRLWTRTPRAKTEKADELLHGRSLEGNGKLTAIQAGTA
jgi:hypothetical protein